MPLDDAMFLGADFIPKSVTMPDGTSRDMLFREPSSGAFRAYFQAEGGNPDAQDAAVGRLIAAALVEPDGKPAITVERAMRLRPQVANQLLAHIMEIGGFALPKPKDAAPDAEGEPKN